MLVCYIRLCLIFFVIYFLQRWPFYFLTSCTMLICRISNMSNRSPHYQISIKLTLRRTYCKRQFYCNHSNTLQTNELNSKKVYIKFYENFDITPTCMNTLVLHFQFNFKIIDIVKTDINFLVNISIDNTLIHFCFRFTFVYKIQWFGV